MSTEEFSPFYAELVQTLPMNDVAFTAELSGNGLLPDDLKDRLESLATSPAKAAYFLDHVIRPSVTSGDRKSLNELLDIMEDSDYHSSMKELAKKIKHSFEISDNG